MHVIVRIWTSLCTRVCVYVDIHTGTFMRNPICGDGGWTALVLDTPNHVKVGETYMCGRILFEVRRSQISRSVHHLDKAMHMHFWIEPHCLQI